MDNRSCMASIASSRAGSGLREKRAANRADAQHAERIVAKGDRRVEWGAQPPGDQVTQPVERVDQLHVGQPQGQRIDR